MNVNAKPAQASAALDALFGDDDVDYTVEEEEVEGAGTGGSSSKNTSVNNSTKVEDTKKNTTGATTSTGGTSNGRISSIQVEGSLEQEGPYSPDFNPIITTQLHNNGVQSQSPTASSGNYYENNNSSNNNSNNSELLLQSPVERINLTPKSKLPPGSGMRKVFFLLFLYILLKETSTCFISILTYYYYIYGMYVSVCVCSLHSVSCTIFRRPNRCLMTRPTLAVSITAAWTTLAETAQTH